MAVEGTSPSRSAQWGWKERGAACWCSVVVFPSARMNEELRSVPWLGESTWDGGTEEDL